MRNVAHASADDRMATGGQARERTPPSGHAGWVPAADRPDPVALLEEQNLTREKDLVPWQPSEMPWSSPTASTVGATGARTAATTETTGATTGATASSTNLERLTAQVARRIEGEAGYELRCRTA